MQTPKLTIAVACLVALAAAGCGRDDAAKKDSDPNTPGKPPQTAEEYRASQRRYSDSLLSSAKTSRDVVQKLGKDYEVGSIKLRDSLAILADKSQCYFRGRTTDPYLAGTVSFFVFMSIVGSNVVRVQESQWSSPAGSIVDACLNLEAKNWKFDPSFGKPAAYITQVQFK